MNVANVQGVAVIAAAASDFTCDVGDALLVGQLRGSGPPAVLVSGIDGRGAFWRDHAGAWAVSWQVISFDQRGTGGSTHSSIRYSGRQLAEDVVSLLDALDIQQASLIGHGLGCGVALELARVHRDRVAKLVLMAPWAGPGPYVSRTFALRERVLRDCGPNDYAALELLSALPACWLNTRPWQIDELTRDRAASLASVDVEASRLLAAAELNIRARLPFLRVPTLVVSAADDQVVPHSVARDVALAIPEARFEAIESGGHYCLYTAGERVGGLVKKFIDA